MNDEPKILAGRYEVGDLIGRGGMAEVHIGYDTRLGRTVAIKILRADLARDPSFQTRFRREAQAAAGLNHPTIVAVYDTGEDATVSENGNPQAVPFIVMEYVEGHTVRDILKGDVAAPIDEAIEIVSGVLIALDYSHHAGLVHRDIKPANVMLTPTGAIKVMDFGIARALADAGQTMTQTQAVVGTAQYLSPEQARGETVDARSDLYSTGCLLFELLTGRPPFMGDSPVSVAYQHVREAAPTPSTFASDVPHELDQVVARALAKGRDDRYSTAQAFLNDLRAISNGEAVDPSTGAIGMGGAGLAHGMTPQEISEQPTEMMSSVGGQPADGTAIMPAGVAPGNSAWAATGAPQSGTVAMADDDLVPDEDEAARKKRQWLILGGAGIAALLLIIALFAFATRGEPEPDVVAVPALAGLTQQDAQDALDEVGLEPDFITEASEDIDEGTVIRSEPDEGEEVEEGDVVSVFVSSGSDITEVPSVRGLDQDTAEQRIKEAGLRVAAVELDDNPDFEEGRVTKTNPEEGDEVSKNTEVTLYVSTGQVELPELVGASEDEALKTLSDLRLRADVTDVETDEERPGTVLSMSPRPGRVERGSEVRLEVAVAPSTRAVPNVVGETEGDARSRLEGEGFSVRVEEQQHDSVEDGRVISQNPNAGTQVAPGSEVTIVVSTGPLPDPDPGPPIEDPEGD
jgi:serine/threonine-protein kinase